MEDFLKAGKQTEMVNLLEATKEDVADIVNIHKDCILKTNSKTYSENVVKEWVNQINEKNVLDQFSNTKWLVLKEANSTVGFCQYDLDGEELYQIQIDPSFQGKGYGKFLYSFIERDFINNRKEKISLFATLNAVPFYESLGFKKVKSIEFPLDNEKIEMVEMAKCFKEN